MERTVRVFFFMAQVFSQGWDFEQGAWTVGNPRSCWQCARFFGIATVCWEKFHLPMYNERSQMLRAEKKMPKKDLGVSKNRGTYPQIIHFNRVFHYNVSILGGKRTLLFGSTPTCFWGNLMEYVMTQKVPIVLMGMVRMGAAMIQAPGVFVFSLRETNNESKAAWGRSWNQHWKSAGWI